MSYKDIAKTTENQKEHIPGTEKENNPKKVNMEEVSKNDIFPEKKQNAVEAVMAKAKAEAQEKPKKRGPGRPPKNKPKEPEVNVDSINAAQITSGILEQLQINLISGDFKYTNEERINNIDAWRKTFDHYGGVNLTPPMELALSHAGIVLVRAQKPGFITKREMLKIWLKEKYLNFKKKLTNKKGKNDARVDTWKDDERQDNVGEEKGQSPQSDIPKQTKSDT